MITHSAPASIYRRCGFSLVEVVLALAVVSMAVIPLFGLIASSLDALRRAGHDTVSRQIMTHLAANAQQARLADLQTQPAVIHYFDHEGAPVKKDDPQRVYTGSVTIQPDDDLLQSESLYRVRIAVAALAASEARHTALRVCPQP